MPVDLYVEHREKKISNSSFKIFMGEFVYTLAENVIEGLASRTYQEISLAWGVSEELNKLKDTFSDIKLVILDAEEKQRKDPLLTQWLGKLKDVCFDVDDVLDEFASRELQTKIPMGIKGKVRKLFSCWNDLVFNFKMGHRIKEIRERLDEIAVEKSRYQLVERVGGDWLGQDQGQGGHIKRERETHSFVQAYDVIGREDDKKLVIVHLLNLDLKETRVHENVSVISIVGLGGIGKTTLAKFVYNDHRVVKNFDTRMWVCVSDQFDNKRLVHDIVASATNQSFGDHESLDQMRKKLQTALKDKQFLLVLDDVWDKNHVGVTIEKWVELKSLLSVGANGSKVIVTARSNAVPSIMGSVWTHELRGLSHESCVSLFMKRAFGRKGDEKRYPQLQEIADSLARKCRGVPLAVTTIGSLLHSKERHVWEQVRDSEIWKLEQGSDAILPALKLSYDALPPYLKSCFAICSLYPKDFVFRSMDLISLWMAQGYLQSSKGGQAYEEIGLDYIRKLCSRSLFQIDEDSIDFIVFRMHNLVHDLAVSVSEPECSSVNFRPSSSNCRRVRHVSMSEDDFPAVGRRVPEFLRELKKVWTILFPVPGHAGIANISLLKACILKFKYLRVLDLNGSTFDVLPNSVGKLSRLRYLNLSNNPFIQKLPSSICNLQNLQTLMLSNCEKLKEFPRDIGNLINLRTLVLTTAQRVLPPGIEHLTSLRFLQVHNCNYLESFGEGIQCLTNLRMLVISNCENLKTLPQGMKCLTALKTLGISDCENLDLSSEEGIGGLRSVSISKASHLEDFPHWLQESANTLQSLRIKNCEDLKELPVWLQSFKLLQQLVIQYCPQLVTLPEGMHLLTALRELKIDGCSELIEGCRSKEGADWPKIAHVSKITLDGEVIASNDEFSLSIASTDY